MPLSLQLVGRPFADATVLRAGYAYEREAGFCNARPDLVIGAAAAEVDPQTWLPDTSEVSSEVQTHAEQAARIAGLNLPADILQELIAVAPHALAMARRLPRDHQPADEVSSVFAAT